MSVLAWILLGLIAGFIASKIMSRRGQGVALDIGIGIAGALMGGWLFTSLGMAGATGSHLYSVLVAVVGAALLLVAYHAVFGSAR
jgi:uncharacterized membrane protein YeaQ/YmgE (transglycosylase-associated protein family)